MSSTPFKIGYDNFLLNSIWYKIAWDGPTI